MSALDPDELRARVASLSVWRRGGQRAPHKPLLLLYALGRYSQGERRIPYSSVEAPLRELLETFGPPRATYHPEYPFWRLQNDGLWTLEGAEGVVQRASNSDPTLTSFRQLDPVGCFPREVAAALDARPALVGELATEVLDAHFASTLHDAILDAVGLALIAPSVRRRRDPRFRTAVLQAYGYRCAVCGFEARVGSQLVGVDAAHVRWHQAGGADEVSNGLALCTLHHRLLDRGAYTVVPDGGDAVVLVSEMAHGGEGFQRWLLDFHGRPVNRPVAASYRVAEPSALWHRREVFRGTARETG